MDCFAESVKLCIVSETGELMNDFTTVDLGACCEPTFDEGRYLAVYRALNGKVADPQM